MDAIPELNVRVSLNLWGGSSSSPMAFRRMSPLAGIQSVERARVAQENLSKLLFGADLSPDELQAYRQRLMRALDMSDNLEDLEEELPEIKEKRVSGPRGSYHVGNVLWTPPPEFQLKPPADAIQVSPVHQVHNVSLLERINLCADCGLAKGPDKPDCGQCGAVERQRVSRVGVFLAAAGEMGEIGHDSVDMSSKGLQQLTEPRRGADLVTTRMPPKFVRRYEMLQLGQPAEAA
ncbi:hypothetical protein DYH09_27235 [bacterium CPR1]|nr:hypothetical protein [bacterium CPR1]